MSDKRPSRNYTEKEVGALIQRATELHEKALGAHDASTSLTLDDIEHIAAEMGLPAEHVRKAAVELERRPVHRRPFSLLGAPFFVEHDEVIGGELTEAQWEEVVLAIRDYTGSTGKVSEFGQVREWAKIISDGGMTLAKTQVSLRPGKDHTGVKIRRHFGGLAVIAYILIPIIMTSFAFVAVDDWGLIGFDAFIRVFGTLITSLALVRTGVHLWSRRLAKKIKHLARVVRDTLTVTRQAPPALAATPVERIELDEEPELEAEAARLAKRMRE